jgi:uncharacterized protein (DUF305 family)
MPADGNQALVIATNWTARRVLAGAGAVLVLCALGSCSTEPPPPPSNSVPVIVPGAPGEEASTIPPGSATVEPQPEPNDADKEFVQSMIVHHQQAVWMAELAPDRASSSDVKGLASRIKDVQKPEIDMMNRWLSRHAIPTVNPSVPGHGHGASHGAMPGMATSEQLDALRNASGTDFDRQFAELMIAHHKGALAMAETVRQKGVDQRIQELADDIVAEQSDDIRRMEKWLAA